jgi:hypothetical protein
MSRGDSRVWSAHTSKSCNMSEKVVVKHNGVTILETVFNPTAKQPRAFMLAYGNVTVENGVATVEV